MSALFFFRFLFAPQAARLALTLGLSLTTLAAGVALLGVSGWFITAAAIAGAGAVFNLFAPSALVRGLSLVRILARYGERLAGHDGTLRLLSDMRGWLFRTLFPKLPLAAEAPRHGDMVSRLTADVDALAGSFLVVVGPLAGAIGIGSIVTAGLAAVLPGASLPFLALYATACLAVPLLLVAATRRQGRETARRGADLRSAVLEGIDGHADLVAFGARARAWGSFDAAAGRLAEARKGTGALVAAASATVQALGGATLLAALWIGLGAYETGALSAPLLVGLSLAVIGSFEAPAAVVRSLAKFAPAAASAERLRDLALAAPRITDPRRPAAAPLRHDIAFDGVSFAYGGGRPVLDGATFRIREGERVAIRAASGDGKTTILRLMLRLLDPAEGRVSLGGVDLKSLCQADIHRVTALLDQSAPVFLDTVRANLLIADATAEDGRLWEALAAARLDGFVRGLPRGLDTRLGETGRTLSAGQARRLCLARTLLSPARIVLLDEPTSGLDRETELAFFADLKRVAGGRTLVLVTHAGLPEGTVDRTLLLTEDGRVRTDQAARPQEEERGP